MSALSYFDHCAGIARPDPFDPTADRPEPAQYTPRKGDTVELPELLTTEGEAAEISNRIYMGEHRWNLERLWAAADLELADDGGIAPLPRSAP